MDSENGAEGAQRNEAGGDAEPARGTRTSTDRQRRAGTAGAAHGSDNPAGAAHGSDGRAGAAVEIESLVKRYGELIAVDGLSLRIGRSEVVGLLGPNGSGKTTTINCLLQLLSYDKGAIRVFGEPMSPTAYGLKRRIGVVPQEVAVFDELTVAENVDAFCALYVRDRGLRRRMVSEAIAFVGLEKFAAFKPKKLSGGLLRRLNIACGPAR